MIKAALFGAALVGVMIIGSVGTPRLIGYDCVGSMGVSFAIEESDFDGPCREIEKLPWIR